MQGCMDVFLPPALVLSHEDDLQAMGGTHLEVLKATLRVG